MYFFKFTTVDENGSPVIPLGKESCEKIAQRQGGCLGRDAVLRVRLGFPIVDARERVPTFDSFSQAQGDHSLLPLAERKRGRSRGGLNTHFHRSKVGL